MAWSRVSGMQTKLHHWAAADPGRRFDDLFNLVYDPATLIVAFDKHVVRIPLFALGTPSVPNCKAAWSNEIVSGLLNRSCDSFWG